MPVTIEKIINEVARTFNITASDIRSRKRSSNISSARMTAMYVVHEITGMTMQEIGKEFGGRDHSTVVYALSEIEKKIAADPRFREIVEDILKNARS